jgi:hypothetical protein
VFQLNHLKKNGIPGLRSFALDSSWIGYKTLLTSGIPKREKGTNRLDGENWENIGKGFKDIVNKACQE